MFVTLKVVLDQGKVKHTTVISKYKSFSIKSINDIDILFGTYTPIRVIFTRVLKSSATEYFVFNFKKESYLLKDSLNSAVTPAELVECIEKLEYKYKGPFLEDDLKCYSVHYKDDEPLDDLLSNRPIVKSTPNHDQVFFNSYLREFVTMYFL